LATGLLKVFRADQREEQVDKNAQRHDTNDDVFHGSDPIEGIGIGNAQRKKADDCQNVNEVHHEPTLLRFDSVVVKTAAFSPLWQKIHRGVACGKANFVP
jgi:hypothetical protein